MNKRMLHRIQRNNNNNHYYYNGLSRTKTRELKWQWEYLLVSYSPTHPSMFIFIIFDKFPSISSSSAEMYLCYLLSTLIQ